VLGACQGDSLTMRLHGKRDTREWHARLRRKRGVVVVCTDAMTDAMRAQPGLGIARVMVRVRVRVTVTVTVTVG
jgi:peptide deformylase